MSFASNKDLLAVTSNSEIGSIIRIAKSTAPTGFLACNGQAVSRSTYAELFSTISTTFGVGDGSTTFNVPFDTSLKQYDLTVTGTNWTTSQAWGIPYKDSEGEWFLRFNIYGSLSSGSSDFNLTIANITGIASRQAVNIGQVSGSTTSQNIGYLNSSTGVLRLTFSASVTLAMTSGDVKLASKPTWVDDNGSDYSINQYIRYAPRTALNAISQSVASKSASHTILDSDGISKFLVTTGSSANVTITLPDASSNPNREIEIIKVDSGTKFVEIAKAGSDTVRGSATSIYAIQQYESIKLIASGTDWVLLGDPNRTVVALLRSGTTNYSNSQSTWGSAADGGTGYADITILTGVFTGSPTGTGCVASNGAWWANLTSVTSTAAILRVQNNDGTLIDGIAAHVSITGKK